MTSSSGLGLVMYGVSEGPNTGWTRGPVVASIAVGALLLAAMVVIELRTAAPLLDLRVYADRLFRPASIVLTLTSVAFFGLLFLLALFFQNGLHLSALQAGSAICPEAVGVIISSQFISRRSTRPSGRAGSRGACLRRSPSSPRCTRCGPSQATPRRTSRRFTLGCWCAPGWRWRRR